MRLKDTGKGVVVMIMMHNGEIKIEKFCSLNKLSEMMLEIGFSVF